MPHDDRPLNCPRCACQLVGIAAPCPNPDAHMRMTAAIAPPERVYGGQVATFYRIEQGIVWIPFRKWDGIIREFPVYWPWVDPITGERLPWMIALDYLYADDLPYIAGCTSLSAFQGASAGFPGRLGSHRIIVETTSFVREYIFGSLVRNARWRRTTRRQKRMRHTADCAPGCRKRHRA